VVVHVSVPPVALAPGVVHAGPAGSPITKSLKDVSPVICVLVEACVPTVGCDHVPLLFLATIKLDVVAPPCTSPPTKLNVAE